MISKKLLLTLVFCLIFDVGSGRVSVFAYVLTSVFDCKMSILNDLAVLKMKYREILISFLNQIFSIN